MVVVWCHILSIVYWTLKCHWLLVYIQYFVTARILTNLWKSCLIYFCSYSSIKPHESYIRYHPKFSQGDHQAEEAYQSACCGNISLGMCDLYYSQRTISRSQTCTDSFQPPYTPFSLCEFIWKSIFLHAVYSSSVRNYTFNAIQSAIDD